MRRFRLFLYLILFLIPLATEAQNLSRADSTEIKKIATYNLRKFEDLLNKISLDDDYFRKYGIDDLFKKYYEDGSPDQIFLDSTIVIEDDINPKSSASTYEIYLPITTYLNNFFKMYEKSTSASIFFDNYQVSDIFQDTVITVTYESQFTKRNKQYPTTPFKKQKKIASFKIFIDKGAPKVLLTHLGFLRTPTLDKEEAIQFDSIVVNAVSQKPEVTKEAVVDSEKQPETTIEPKFEAKTDSLTNMEMADSSQMANQKDQIDAIEFINLKTAYTPGKVFRLNWSPAPSNPATLSLFKGDKFVIDLKNNIQISEFTNVLPKTGENGKIKPGKDYHFQLSEPATKKFYKSGTFKIKSRFPLALQIPIYAAVAGTVAYFILRDTTSPPTSPAEFPLPPSPQQ